MNIYQLLMFGILVVSLIFMGIDLIRTYNKCPEDKIIYRYIPRSFIEEQQDPVPLDDIFYDMFNNPTVWVASIDFDRRKKEIGQDLNKYYLSQI